MEDDVRREFAEVGKRLQDIEKKLRDYILANPTHPAPNMKSAVDVAKPVVAPVEVAKPVGAPIPQTKSDDKPMDLSKLKS